MKVLVVGHKGMLGHEVLRVFSERYSETIGMDIEQIDITDRHSCERAFRDVSPEVVVNCAAFTDVDGAETQVEAAFAVNALGPQHLAQLCAENEALLVHISTDYVFSGHGDRPYKAADKTAPQSVYGRSKLEGEQRVIAVGGQYIILRIAWLFGPHGKSFPKTMLQLFQSRSEVKVVADQHGCPTYAPDIAEFITLLVEKEARGIHQLTNRGITTWYDFAKEILKQSGIKKVRLRPCTTAEFPRAASRPSYSVLDIEPTEAVAGKRIRSWRHALTDFFKALEEAN